MHDCTYGSEDLLTFWVGWLDGTTLTFYPLLESWSGFKVTS